MKKSRYDGKPEAQPRPQGKIIPTEYIDDDLLQFHKERIAEIQATNHDDWRSIVRTEVIEKIKEIIKPTINKRRQTYLDIQAELPEKCKELKSVLKTMPAPHDSEGLRGYAEKLKQFQGVF